MNEPAPLQTTAYWADLTEHLIELAGCFPADKLDWRPAANEWSAKQIVAAAESRPAFAAGEACGDILPSAER